MVSPCTDEEVLRKRFKKEAASVAEATIRAVWVINNAEKMSLQARLATGHCALWTCNCRAFDAGAGFKANGALGIRHFCVLLIS